MSETKTNKETKKPNYKARRLLTAGVAGIALLGVGKAAADLPERINGEPVEQHQPGISDERNFDVVIAKSGDTPWDLAREAVGLEENIGPMVQELSRQADADGNPGLQIGEKLHIPKDRS